MARKMMLIPVEKFQFDQPEEKSTALDVDVILSAIPKNFRNRAKALLNHIMADPQQGLRWNNHGELIYKGKVVPGSHITDLLKNSQRQYKHLKLTGLEEFRNGLKDLNIPIGLMEYGPPGILKQADHQQWLTV